MDNETNFRHFPISRVPVSALSAVDRGRQYDRDPDHDRANYDSESRIMIFFDFFVNIEYSAEYAISNTEKYDTDRYKDQRRYQSLQQLIELDDKPENTRNKRFQHYFPPRNPV